MAFIICKRHGGHVATFLCSHLRDALYRREPLPEIFYVQAWYLDAPPWSYHICPMCAREDGITENPTIWRDDGSLDRFFALKCDAGPACRLCFDEMQRSSRGISQSHSHL